MAGDVSFDVVSDFDPQELRNALDQVRREIVQRYDFKGAHVELTQGKDEIVLVADDEFRAKSVRDLIESKAVRRRSEPQDLRLGHHRAGRRQARQAGDRPAPGTDRRAGQADQQAHPRRVPQCKAQIQGDAVRVSGKSKDELQKVITRLRGLDESVPLQFINYR